MDSILAGIIIVLFGGFVLLLILALCITKPDCPNCKRGFMEKHRWKNPDDYTVWFSYICAYCGFEESLNQRALRIAKEISKG